MRETRFYVVGGQRFLGIGAKSKWWLSSISKLNKKVKR
jgi:hypothetical protein